jgi:hypothetical protein
MAAEAAAAAAQPEPLADPLAGELRAPDPAASASGSDWGRGGASEAASPAVTPPQPAAFLGFDAGRRNSVAALDDETIALVAGAGVFLLHLPTGGQRHLRSRDGGGVGALAVHPQRTCFAVAEKRRDGPPSM